MARKLETIETEISLARLELNEAHIPEIVVEPNSPEPYTDLDSDKIETASSHSDAIRFRRCLTFWVLSLRIGTISWSVCPWQAV